MCNFDYLHECRRLFGVVSEIRYGRQGDLAGIQASTAEIRRGSRLNYEDLEEIRNSDIWDANQFGYWPSRTEIESHLKSRHWNFHNLHRNPDREGEAIAGLLDLFHQIEVVSVILRFVDPRHFGILSPPVEKVLGIGPSRNHVNKYLGYLNNLRQLKSERNFATAADVDLALWTLQLGVLEERLREPLGHQSFEELRTGYENDQDLASIRLTNLAPQLEGLPPLNLARALLESGNTVLAGQVAACEFERQVALRSAQYGLTPGRDVRLWEMIKSCWAGHPRLRDLDPLAEVRNRAIHTQGVRRSEVQQLIDVAKELAEDRL